MAVEIAQVKQASIDAMRAGDIEKAKKLKALYMKYSDSQPQGQPSIQQYDVPKKPDNAFEYSVDQAQRLGGKGIEAIGRAVDAPQVEEYGSGVVEQQDKDIQQGGYTPSHTKSLRDTFNQDGVGAAASWLGEKTAENSVSGGAALIGGLGTAAVATVSAPAAAVLGLGTLVASGTMGAGEAAFEQEDKVGDYDSQLAVGQGIIIGFLDKFGAGKVIPKSRLLKMSSKEIIDELNKKGFGQAAKAFAKKTAFEGTTEVAQEGVSIAGAASRGGEYNQTEVEDRAIESFALGSTNAGVAQTVVGGASLVSGKPANLGDRASQATFAQRLDALSKEGTADGTPFNLTDIDPNSATGVRALIDLSHASIRTDIQALTRDLDDSLNTRDATLSSKELGERQRVIAMLKQAVNKTKSVVGSSDFSLLQKLVGNTPDGKRLINLVKESQEQTKVWNAGMKGGLSKFTDQANPFPQGGNYSGQANTANAIRGLASTGAAIGTGGASLAPQAAVFAGGRMIDAITGRRSKVRRYIANNKGKQGLATVTGVGERDKGIARTKKFNEEALEKARQAKSAERATHYYNYTQNAPAHPDSPQGIYERFTGLDRAGLENGIDEILADPNFDQGMRVELEDLIESMKFGSRVSGFAALRHINGILDRMPPESNLRVNVPEDRMPNGTPLEAVEAKYTDSLPANQQRGKVANNLEVDRLKAQLEADKSVSQIDKTELDNALTQLRSYLSNPVSDITAIEKQLFEQGVPPDHIARYIGEYKTRIIKQQERSSPNPE